MAFGPLRGGHWSRTGDYMAKIKYIGNQPRISMIKDMSCKRGETIDIHPIHALSYMGANDFKIKLDAKDKEILSKVNRKFHIRQLNREFGGQGLNEALERAFPTKVPSVFRRKATPKKKEVKKEPVKKPIARKEPKKEKVKPPIEKKLAKKPAVRVKKPMKESEL